jgi:hypothetical protein
MGCSTVNDGDAGAGDGANPGEKTAHEQSAARDRLGYEPEVRAVESAEEEVNKISSKVLEWMALQGKVSEQGAAAGSCGAVDPDFSTYYVVSHPWSVYDVRKGSFAGAMANLRRELPENGWKVTKDGRMKTKAANPEIVAVHLKTHHTLTVQWLEKRSGDLKEIISIDVDSRCYRAPEGTDLSGG